MAYFIPISVFKMHEFKLSYQKKTSTTHPKSPKNDAFEQIFRQLTPPYEYASTPGNAAELGSAHRNIQAVQSCPSLVGIEPTMH